MDETECSVALGEESVAILPTLLVVAGPREEDLVTSALRGRLLTPDGRAIILSVVPDLVTALAHPGAVIVLYQSAESALSNAMAQGTTPSEALTAWKSAMAPQLTLLLQNRRRITLIDTTALSGDCAEDMLARLAVRLGLDVAPTAGPRAVGPSDVSSVIVALARVCLAENTEAQALAWELGALVLNPTEASPTQTRGLADSAFTAHLALARNVGGPPGAERDLLLEQMHHMQQQLVQAQAETESLARRLLDTKVRSAAELQTSRTQLVEAETRAATTRAELDIWKTERGFLLVQLGHMQQQVEQAQAEAAVAVRVLEDVEREASALLTSERARFTEELQAERREVALLLASTSWRVTAPLRAVKRGLTRLRSSH